MEQLSIKYRPRTIDTIFGQDIVKRDLKARITSGKWPKAMLFRGPFGTGKTSAAHITAMAIQCSNPKEDGSACLECPSCKSIMSERFDRNTTMLDGGQLSGKDAVLEFTSTINVSPMFDKKHVFIIEEADQLSGAAINTLLKVLEAPSQHAHFILLSMEKKGIPPAIISRCQTFDFKPLGITDTMMALKYILEQEGKWMNESIPQEFFTEGLASIAEYSKGSMRDAVQYIDQALTGQYYTKEALSNLFSSIDMLSTYKILEGLIYRSKDDALWSSIMKADPQELFHYLTLVLSNVMIYKTTGFLTNEAFENSTKKIAFRVESEELFNLLVSSPQLAKPYIRQADLLAVIAQFYLQAPPEIPVRNVRK